MTTEKIYQIAIDGPSGAGKSTIARTVARRLGIDYIDTGAMYRAFGLKMLRQGIPMIEDARLLAMLEETDIDFAGGRVYLDGEDITFMPQHVRAKNIGRLYQDPMRGTAPGMTILENLALAAGQGGWLSRISKSDKQRFREQLALLDIGLEDRMNHPVGLLSGGQRQALTLLMATMNPPKLLLLDEHTAALDPGTAEKVLNLTSRIVKEHQLTCLMITHNMQSALELGNRILMMDSGDIVLDIHEEEKKGLTVEGLLEKFKTGAGKMLDNDRILLSGEK